MEKARNVSFFWQGSSTEPKSRARCHAQSVRAGQAWLSSLHLSPSFRNGDQDQACLLVLKSDAPACCSFTHLRLVSLMLSCFFQMVPLAPLALQGGPEFSLQLLSPWGSALCSSLAGALIMMGRRLPVFVSCVYRSLAWQKPWSTVDLACRGPSLGLLVYPVRATAVQSRVLPEASSGGTQQDGSRGRPCTAG